MASANSYKADDIAKCKKALLDTINNNNDLVVEFYGKCCICEIYSDSMDVTVLFNLADFDDALEIADDETFYNIDTVKSIIKKVLAFEYKQRVLAEVQYDARHGFHDCKNCKAQRYVHSDN